MISTTPNKTNLYVASGLKTGKSGPISIQYFGEDHIMTAPRQ